MGRCSFLPVCLPDRGAAIAGKPGSHKGWCGFAVSVGAPLDARLPVMQATRYACRIAVLPSRASPAPTTVGAGSRYLWECRSTLDCQRCRQPGMPAGSRCCHRGQARLPLRLVRFPGISGSAARRSIASDAGNPVCLPDRGAAIAGKPGSHKGWCGSPVSVGAPLDARLPVMQATRYACRIAVLPSRASPAPTKVGAGSRYLWERRSTLDCQRFRQPCMPAGSRCCHRGQARLPLRLVRFLGLCGCKVCEVR